ncbi:hypothetical protein [Porphyromonas gulae]|uniref:hypothetical protein n=1 Tax=Porphyromonas gulae TaxID=111105 RepID=UPI001F3E888B|nr:hypothetical protein [Porphyromonas gulae]
MKKFSRHVFGSTKQENSGAQTDRSSGMQKGYDKICPAAERAGWKSNNKNAGVP